MTKPFEPEVKMAIGKPVEVLAKISNGQVCCGACNVQLGTVEHGGLRAGNIIVTNPKPIRCAACFTRNRYVPPHYQNRK